MNILILSVGTRNKIIQYFKRELEGRGKVIATDNSNLAPAIYEADKFYLVPRITEENYIEKLKQICRNEKIDAMFSLIDPELSLLALHKKEFEEIGTKVIVADYEAVERCFDKYEFAIFLEKNGFKTPKTYNNIQMFIRDCKSGKISFPVFVKPCRGSASIHVSQVNDLEELEILLAKYDDLIVQEYMDGQELGIDVYVDMISGEVTSIFIKEKIKMRAGETDKSVSIKDEQLFKIISDLAKKLKLYGQNDIDVFRVNGEYYISEVNPRFGGGYPHAYECGVNEPEMLINNLLGIKNEVAIGEYDAEVYMAKYNEIKIIKG
ncbi:ATP-grasp domain-containing protein [Zhenhengia yiwuensis]|uniref:ATP-grasp domain-containing protein n=1 Tax=Zhenhengia yiwuensis TaxID=2763666 RepID=A0A926EHA7_9FIRM|nr:ATP-grasp domain-containing protein [Zhenhengia yiwuensis]MBC8578950.1 ATP-grasp domain-containing protein [Zhenhengia yiwuensis]